MRFFSVILVLYAFCIGCKSSGISFIRAKNLDRVKTNTDSGMSKVYFQQWCRTYIENKEEGVLYFGSVHELLRGTKPSIDVTKRDSEVVGKFYHDQLSSDSSVTNYIVGIKDWDHFDYDILYHIQKSSCYKVVKDTTLSHGNYTCYGEDFSGFGKMGQYYYWDQNSTGSGFCACNRFFFDENLRSINHLGVPTYMWSFWEEGFLGMHSEMRLKGPGILSFRYILEDGTCPDKGGDCDFEEIPLRQQSVLINYKITSDSLSCMDPDLFKQYMQDGSYSYY